MRSRSCGRHRHLDRVTPSTGVDVIFVLTSLQYLDLVYIPTAAYHGCGRDLAGHPGHRGHLLCYPLPHGL